MLISFANFEVTPRYDGGSWGSVTIYETADVNDPFSWAIIDTLALEFSDPTAPDPVDITTENASLPVGVGYYKLRFIDAEDNGIYEETDPIFNQGPIEILCTIDDVNAHLDGEVIKADANNSNLIQISVARIVKGYLGKVFDSGTMAAWASPDTTPDIIRECASLFIAAQVLFNAIARTSTILEDQNVSQRLYDEAKQILDDIVNGIIPVPGEIPGGGTGDNQALGPDDFFPVDDTDRAFTMSMRLD